MGIDWEEILDAEGEDLARAYDDSIPDDDWDDEPNPEYGQFYGQEDSDSQDDQDDLYGQEDDDDIDLQMRLTDWYYCLERISHLDPDSTLVQDIIEGKLDLSKYERQDLSEMMDDLQVQKVERMLKNYPELDCSVPSTELLLELDRREQNNELEPVETPDLDEAIRLVSEEMDRRDPKKKKQELTDTEILPERTEDIPEFGDELGFV